MFLLKVCKSEPLAPLVLQVPGITGRWKGTVRQPEHIQKRKQLHDILALQDLLKQFSQNHRELIQGRLQFCQYAPSVDLLSPFLVLQVFFEKGRRSSFLLATFAKLSRRVLNWRDF